MPGGDSTAFSGTPAPIERELNRAILRLQQLPAERRKQQPAAPPKAMAATACAASTPAPEFVQSQPSPLPAPKASG